MSSAFVQGFVTVKRVVGCWLPSPLDRREFGLVYEKHLDNNAAMPGANKRQYCFNTPERLRNGEYMYPVVTSAGTSTTMLELIEYTWG